MDFLRLEVQGLSGNPLKPSKFPWNLMKDKRLQLRLPGRLKVPHVVSVLLFFLFKFTKMPNFLLELPQRRHLTFFCGVEIEISFSALYSNVLVAFATVKSTDRSTQDCTVMLSSLPVSMFPFNFKCIFLIYLRIKSKILFSPHYMLVGRKKNPLIVEI